LIFQQFAEAGKRISPETTRELLESIKVYNPIPPEEEAAYAAVLAQEYSTFLTKKGSSK
jgi:hypothetical protein